MEVINKYGTETPEKQAVFTCPFCSSVFRAKKRELGFVKEPDEFDIEEGILNPYYSFECPVCELHIEMDASSVDEMYDEKS